MQVINGIAYEDDFAEKVQSYLNKGFDQRTAEYFASGRRQIISVSPNTDYSLNIVFDNGEERKLDCKPFLKEGTVFEPFIDMRNFNRVYLDNCHCISWDIDPAVNSEIVWSNKVDLCPDSCYLDSVPM